MRHSAKRSRRLWLAGCAVRAVPGDLSLVPGPADEAAAQPEVGLQLRVAWQASCGDFAKAVPLDEGDQDGLSVDAAFMGSYPAKMSHALGP